MTTTTDPDPYFDLHPDVRQDLVLDLVADTPLHVGGLGVGGLGGDTVVDLALATDGQDRLYVPGSSWAGVLRAFTRRHLGAGLAEELFGASDPDDGRASRLTVSDSVIGPDPRVELRTGVGIDRRTGAAATRVVYDRLVLPAGTTLALRIRYEGPVTEDVTALAAAVRAVGLRLGAASSRGLGRLRCDRVSTVSTDLTSRTALLTTLGGAPAVTEIDAADAVGTPRFVIAWRPLRPVVVGGPSPGESADLVPLLTRTPGGLVPVLPGSSVKGVLRSIAERVVRTVLRVEDPTGDAVASAAALAARVPALEALFGSVERAGALSVPDTAALCPPVSTPDWRGYLGTGSPAPPWSRERTHVAIDRWTGGAADQRLFTVQETTAVTWPELRLDLDETRIRAEHRRPVVVLLGVAVALLHDGTFGLGHGTTRGLGEIEVSAVTVEGLDRLELPGPPGPTVEDWWAWLSDTAQVDLQELLT